MSAYTDYNYGTSARRFEEQQDLRFEVVAGGAPEQETQAVSSVVARAVRILAVVVAVFAVVGAVRITFDSLTIGAALESTQISRDIDAARKEGNALELEKSMLSNPGRIKAEAKKIDMAAPAQTTYIDLSGDVVVTDEAGSLSLSGSMAAAAG